MIAASKRQAWTSQARSCVVDNNHRLKEYTGLANNKAILVGITSKTINMFNRSHWKQRKLIRLHQQTSALEKVVIMLTRLPNTLPSPLPDLGIFTLASSGVTT